MALDLPVVGVTPDPVWGTKLNAALTDLDGRATDATVAGYVSAGGPTETALNATFGLISGVVADDTTDNAAAIQAALDQGGRWRLPPTTGRYLVNGPLEVSVAGTTFEAYSAPIRQGVADQSLFNIAVPDVTIAGVDATGATSKLNTTGMTAAWEMSIVASRWTVINAYYGADRLSIPWIRGAGFSSVVRVTNWDRTIPGIAAGHVGDVKLGTLLCNNVEFGLIVQGVDRFSYQNVSGSYVYPTGGTRPPHLLYFSGTGGENTDITGGTATASYEGGTGGQAFQFKGITRGAIGSVIANGCPGTANIMDNHDLQIGSIVSVGDTVTGTLGSVIFDATVEQARVKVDRIALQLVNDASAVIQNAGDRLNIGELDVDVAHTTSATTYDVRPAGTNTRIGRLRVRNTGTNSWRALGLWSGDGHRIDRAILTNVRIGIEVRTTATNAVIGYDPLDVTLHPTDGVFKIMVDPSAAPTLRTPQVPTNTLIKVSDQFMYGPNSGTSFGAAQTGQQWTGVLGTWLSDLINNEASETAGTAQSNAYLDAGISNVEISANVKLTGYPGFVMRWVSTTQYLCVYLSATGVVIGKRDTTLVTLQNGPAVTYQTGRWYDLRVRIYGSQIDVYVDNQFSVTYTLTSGDATTFGTSTKHGLFSSASGPGASRWRNFLIRQL